MARRKRTRGSSFSPGNNWLVMVAAAVGAFALIAITVVVVNASPPLRSDDLCLANEAPKSVVVVVVDASGEFTEVQQRALRDRFYRALDRLAPSDDPTRPVGAEVRVDIYNANAPLGRLIEPVFSRCSTPELSGLQLLAGNAARERREYEQEFAQPLDDIIRSLVAGQSSRTSPILESLTAAVEQSLAGRTSDQRHSIILVSDLLQNSDLVTFYGGSRVPDFSAFLDLPGRHEVSPDLRGATLCPIVINRSTDNEDRLQTGHLVDWWARYSDQMRGRFDGWCIQELQL